MTIKGVAAQRTVERIRDRPEDGGGDATAQEVCYDGRHPVGPLMELSLDKSMMGGSAERENEACVKKGSYLCKLVRGKINATEGAEVDGAPEPLVQAEDAALLDDLPGKEST